MRSYEFAEDYRKNDAIRRADVGIGPYKRPPISTAHTQMIRKYPMRNIALTLKYLGTAYHGWQVQKTVTTVGQTLEEAAAAVVGHPVHMTGCGRTDAGVHARVYVANFRTSARIPCDRIPYALNTHLPEDIVVTNAMEVHEDFNAIGSCVKKEYTYLIYNSGIRDPFYVNRAWFYPKHLDETVMQRAADCFIGTHDFAAVRSVGTDVKSTVRTVYDYKVERDGDLISLRVSANGFLYIWPAPWRAPASMPPKESSRRRPSRRSS